jgi:hypothetical protein
VTNKADLIGAAAIVAVFTVLPFLIENSRAEPTVPSCDELRVRFVQLEHPSLVPDDPALRQRMLEGMRMELQYTVQLYKAMRCDDPALR